MVGFVLTAAACAGAPHRDVDGNGARPRGVAASSSHVTVEIVFEPALPEAGELRALHEDGSRVTVATGRTGVDIELPPGPAVLLLRVGDSERQRILTVRESSAPREFVFDTAGMAP